MNWRAFKCWLFRHRFIKVRPLAIGGDLIRCEKCGIELCIHHGRQQVIPFDDDVKRVEAEIRSAIDQYRK